MSFSDQDHDCQPEEQVAGIIVTLHLDALRPLCPQRDEAALQAMLKHHAQAIAAHMIGAGMEAAGHLFRSDGGPS